MLIIKWIIIASFIIITAIFSALNSQPIEINYFIGKQSLPLAFLLFLAMCFGVIFTSMLLGSKLWIAKHKIKQIKSQLDKLKNNPK